MNIAVLAILLGACLLGGGASRTDVVSLLYLRPIAIIALAYFLWTKKDWQLIRPVAIGICAFAVLHLLHLVPLPPGIVDALPGQDLLNAIRELNGTASRWVPLSISPDATWNSLLALVVPAAVLLGLASVSLSTRQGLVMPLIVAILAGGMLGVLQVLAGDNSPFYLYRVSSPGAATGWFANRNHEAVALAFLFPLLRVWLEQPSQYLERPQRQLVAIGLAVIVLPLIVITGSRTGMLLGVLSLVASALIAPLKLDFRKNRLLLAIGLAVFALPVLLFALGGRALSIDRFANFRDLGGDYRFQYLPTEFDITRDFWPIGSGLGTFVESVLMYEPDELLGPTYMNHAHNDFLELFMTAGLPGVLLAFITLALLVRWTWQVFLSSRSGHDNLILRRCGATMVWLIVAGSIVDYPLRTPLMAALAVLAVVWLRQGSGRSVRRRSSGRSKD